MMPYRSIHLPRNFINSFFLIAAIVTNNIKYLGVTLTKEVKDLYDNNFKSLKKEIEVGILFLWLSYFRFVEGLPSCFF